MDMKRILQAMDGVATKPVVGSSDMAKFLSIVDKPTTESVITEGSNPHKVALPVQMAMQHFQKPVIKAEKQPSLLNKYFAEAEESFTKEKEQKQELLKQYASVIAERVMMKESGEAGWNRTGMAGVGIMQGEDQGEGEGVTVKNSLHTIIRVATHLDKALNNQDNFPEWVSEKIGSVKDQMVSVMDYEISNRELTGDNITEMPIAATDDPNDPVIHGHEKANSMTLKGRIAQARAQLKELAQLAERNDLLAWEEICKKAKGGMFMGLEQNLEQIRHGIAELANKRRKGGTASRGIDKNIS